ncbi:SPFH domain, Band 7 family protein (plasmid) [Stanieria cyanosphaera PCC 7437]|uniref:SPFH domain, Band 7 family protein n=1 Tax=Stanieria cyanosphaera (strain ATCC 29371 / PCC 7437) TaxID=111780 RepID=K9XZL2_STAC7|nr:SPFH domain-containing protein [Stanieria cyanosphaera]AFZ38040.1 SPFH domain, Band 7 family protein [Stanieria cyanosphaera PCC 7437]
MEMLFIIIIVAIVIILLSIRICNQWEDILIFTLGRLSKTAKPGMYLCFPIIQTAQKVDKRTITYTVPLQKGLTRDNIPVEVDAILFYKVRDSKVAVLNVDNYHQATQLAVRSSIRDMVGKSSLDELLSQRDKIGDIVMEHIAEFVCQWGILIVGVEIKDVIVSKELEEAISREAAAEREKRARVKLAEAEELTVDAIAKAAEKYAKNPVSLQLRAMNMLYEMCMEGKSTMLFVPTNNSGTAMPTPLGIESIDTWLERSHSK